MCKVVLWLCALLALASPLTCSGELTISTSTVLDASNQFPFDSLRVVDGVEGTTTISVTAGALVGKGIQLYGGSNVVFLDGEVFGDAANEGLNMFDSSIGYMLGGDVYSDSNDGIATRGSSTLYVSGGNVVSESGTGLLARNSSRVFVTGGNILASVKVGGTFLAPGVTTTNAARVEMSGGAVASEALNAVRAENTSQWLISGGLLSAGADSAALLMISGSRATITGGSFQTSGEFAFELRDNAQIEFRDGEITGGILASGASQIHVYGFNLRSAFGELTGTLEGGGSLNARYQLLDDAQLILHSLGVAGDTDGDQDVDLADLNNVRNNFGGTGLGDANGDDQVDLQDLNDVRNHFGFQGSSPRVAPEPSSLALLALSLLAFSWLSCRRDGQFSKSRDSRAQGVPAA